ncbi:hypothetical protein BVY01_03230 [bacterium I07]|nr:hypothetical protein BVY01_03230 [bacterium I07]
MAFIKLRKLCIPIEQITDGMAFFSYKLNQPDFITGEHFRFPDPVEGETTVTQVDGDFLMEIAVRSKGVFTCDRCGEDYESLIEGSIKTLMTMKPENARDDESGDIKLLAPGIQEIDFTQDARDALHLAIPVKLLCKKDCAGLCAGCGQNLNDGICSCPADVNDSRWDALKNINWDEQENL